MVNTNKKNVTLDKVYRDLNQLLYQMEGHYWSKRITQEDAAFAAYIRKQVQEAANNIYVIQHPEG